MESGKSKNEFLAGHSRLPAGEEPDGAVPAGLQRAALNGGLIGRGGRDGVRAVRALALPRRDRDGAAAQLEDHLQPRRVAPVPPPKGVPRAGQLRPRE